MFFGTFSLVPVLIQLLSSLSGMGCTKGSPLMQRIELGVWWRVGVGDSTSLHAIFDAHSHHPTWSQQKLAKELKVSAFSPQGACAGEDG